jgi:hypothetical protein
MASPLALPSIHLEYFYFIRFPHGIEMCGPANWKE